MQIRRRHHGRNQTGCDGRTRVLRAAIATGCHLRRSDPPGRAGATVRDRSRLRSGRTSRIDRACAHCWGRYGLCGGPSCLANIYCHSGCAALCAPVPPENWRPKALSNPLTMPFPNRNQGRACQNTRVTDRLLD